jgi:predicted alpha/beta hydrolase family esterase
VATEPMGSGAPCNGMTQILFIQGGGGHDVHDAWDDRLVASLKRELGEGYDVRYPRMPDEDDPKYAKWKPVIRREIDALDDGAILAGHSIGAAMLVNALTEVYSCEGRSPDSSSGTGPLPSGSPQSSTLRGAPAQGNKEAKLGAILLISAPFVGKGGWPAQEFTLPFDLGARLPDGVPVHLFHGSEDETAPPKHADLYAKAIPKAEVHRLPGRDHQLIACESSRTGSGIPDLKEVAEVVRAVVPEAEPAAY